MMAHYDCTCCGETMGISHDNCPNCKSGGCGRTDKGLLTADTAWAKRVVENSETSPVRILTDCPECHTPHVDRDEWETRPHKTHLYEKCGHKWRPAVVCTVGVTSL